MQIYLSQAVLAQVRTRQGIDFTSYKTPTILRRLLRRVAATSTGTLTDYGAYLESHPEEYRRLVSSFLINVTEFFRDAALFDELRDRVLPDLIAGARARGEELRLWSAGCATGEEAYSLAILVAEALGEDPGRLTVRLFATDLDADAIAFARRGVYAASALATLPDNLRARYFTPVDDSDGAYEVTKRIRNLVVFGEHDLGQRPPFPRIDLVVCRNVLIYFMPEMQTRALQLFAFALRPGGYLALGTSETSQATDGCFVAAHPCLKIYRRTDASAPAPPMWRPGATPRHATDALPPAAVVDNALPTGDVRALVMGEDTRAPVMGEDRRALSGAVDLLDDVPWGVVVVNPRYDIQSINRAARHLLGIYRDAVGDDFIHLALHVPSTALRAAIDAAFRDAAPSRIEGVVPVGSSTGEEHYLQLACQPRVANPTSGAVEAVMVLVSDGTEMERVSIKLREEIEGAAARQQEEMARLTARVQQMSVSNQEMLAANDIQAGDAVRLRRDTETARVDTADAQAHTEEIMTLNEELQSTNEEMETLNEELQATVEEVQTTNVELEAHRAESQELTATLEAERAQLAVILADIGDAVLVVGSTGLIVRTNPAYVRLTGDANASLVPEDARGQPLPSGTTPQERAGRGEAFRQEFTLIATDGSRGWYEANGRPLHDHGLAVGVVVIRDITLANKQRQLQEEFLALSSHELCTPLTTVKGYLELLKPLLRESGDEQSLVYAARALRQTQRLVTLVRDLMDVTRLQTGKLTFEMIVTDLGMVVKRAVETARDMPPGHTVIFADDADMMLRVVGDAGRLEQVFLNLLTNAFTYAASDDAVEVRLHCVGAEVALERCGRRALSGCDVGTACQRTQDSSHDHCYPHHRAVACFFRVADTADIQKYAGIYRSTQGHTEVRRDSNERNDDCAP